MTGRGVYFYTAIFDFPLTITYSLWISTTIKSGYKPYEEKKPGIHSSIWDYHYPSKPELFSFLPSREMGPS